MKRRVLLLLPAALAATAVPAAHAACPPTVSWQGHAYRGIEIQGRSPLRLGAKLKGATVPACGGGASEPVNIRGVRDVPHRLVVARPDEATPTNAFVYVRRATYWKAANHPLRRAVRPKLATSFTARSGCRSVTFKAVYRRARAFDASRISVRSGSRTRTVRLEPPTRLGRTWRSRPFRRGDALRISGTRCAGGVLTAHSIA